MRGIREREKCVIYCEFVTAAFCFGNQKLKYSLGPHSCDFTNGPQFSSTVADCVSAATAVRFLMQGYNYPMKDTILPFVKSAVF
jgi:hypothetical protein